MSTFWVMTLDDPSVSTQIYLSLAFQYEITSSRVLLVFVDVIFLLRILYMFIDQPNV